jgi:hypothetical protein
MLTQLVKSYHGYMTRLQPLAGSTRSCRCGRSSNVAPDSCTYLRTHEEHKARAKQELQLLQRTRCGSTFRVNAVADIATHVCLGRQLQKACLVAAELIDSIP